MYRTGVARLKLAVCAQGKEEEIRSLKAELGAAKAAAAEQLEEARADASEAVAVIEAAAAEALQEAMADANEAVAAAQAEAAAKKDSALAAAATAAEDQISEAIADHQVRTRSLAYGETPTPSTPSSHRTLVQFFNCFGVP